MQFALFLQVPDAVAFFPLNSTFGTKEIKNRVAEGDASGVTFAPGPDGVAGGSYEFSGYSNSFIEFFNSEGGPLDVRHSMTMLCWVYYKGKNGPLFDYRATGKAGVHLWVNKGKLYVYFRSRGYLDIPHLWHTVLAGGWKFVGASYDHSTGDANLWVNGAVVYTRNIGIGLDLATNDSIRMGAYDRAYFKGRIAHMQVYDKALTQEQMQAIQQQTEVVGEYVTKQKCPVEACRFPGVPNWLFSDVKFLYQNHREKWLLFSGHLLTVSENFKVCHIAHCYSKIPKKRQFHWLP